MRPPMPSRSSPMRCCGSSNPRDTWFRAKRPGAVSSNTPLSARLRERPVKRITITARRCGKRIDLIYAGGNMVGDPQCRHYVNEPRSAKVAQRFEGCGFLFWHMAEPPGFQLYRACSIRCEPDQSVRNNGGRIVTSRKRRRNWARATPRKLDACVRETENTHDHSYLWLIAHK